MIEDACLVDSAYQSFVHFSEIVGLREVIHLVVAWLLQIHRDDPLPIEEGQNMEELTSSRGQEHSACCSRL